VLVVAARRVIGAMEAIAAHMIDSLLMLKLERKIK
jgi:hypothetical protein